MTTAELPGMPEGPIGRILQYLSFRKAREALAKEEGLLKDVVLADLVAEEADEKGNRFLYLDVAVDGVAGVKRERRSSLVMDEDAAMLLIKAHGLEETCIVQVPTIDEDAILAANYRGEVSDEEMKALYTEKESFAFVLVKE